MKLKVVQKERRQQKKCNEQQYKEKEDKRKR